MKMEEYLQKANSLEIVSGEGEIGTAEEYKGKRTIKAVKARLTKERCNGDRWAYLKIDGQQMDLD